MDDKQQFAVPPSPLPPPVPSIAPSLPSSSFPSKRQKNQKVKTTPTERGKLALFIASVCFGVSFFTFLFAMMLFILRV
ncbi:hypothetical protein ACH3XW_5365 [Acanthocheilonema viteae]